MTNNLSKSSSLARARSRTPPPQRSGADELVLTVRTCYGGSFQLNGVHACDTSDLVKVLIQQQEWSRVPNGNNNIPMSEITLVQELESGRGMGWYGMQRSGEVRMVPTRVLDTKIGWRPRIPLYVYKSSASHGTPFVDAKIISVAVFDDDVRIGHLKELIDHKFAQTHGEEERINDHQKLAFLGETLDNDKDLGHYQIGAGCMLEVVTFFGVLP